MKLIRKDPSGKKEIHTLNLNDADIVNSPYYYLQQNDVVYVEPNKVKAQNSSVGSMTTLWFSATSILISLTSLMYNILKYARHGRRTSSSSPSQEGWCEPFQTTLPPRHRDA